MRVSLVVLVALLVAVPATAQLDRNAVHNVFTVDSLFAEWEATYSGFVERMTIGESEGGFPLHGVIVTDEAVPFDGPPHSALTKHRVYLDGGHHGNEFLGVEIGLYYVESLLDRAAAGDQDVRHLLATTEIHMVPILNVEGNLRDTRVNLNGVDPNRNYDFGHTPCSIPIGLNCGGPEPFSESEIRANADYVTAISPDLWLSMHTGIEVLYYPGGEPFVPAPADQALFDAMEGPFEDVVDGRIDMTPGPAPAVGSAEDWGYAVLGINSFVYEVHNDQNLPVYGQPITDLLQSQLDGMAWLVEGAARWGALVDLEQRDDGVWAVNHGLGAARPVTVHHADGTTVIGHLGPGNATRLQVGGSVAWEYPTLLIETSRLRSHEAMFDDLGGASANDVPVPLVAFVLALVAGAAMRRKA